MSKRPRNKYFWWAMVNLVLAIVLIAELAVACLTDLLGLEVLVVPFTLLALVSVVLSGRQNWILWAGAADRPLPEKKESATMKAVHKRKVAMRAPLKIMVGVLALVLVAIVWVSIMRAQQRNHYVTTDPFSRILVVSAPGCEVNGPDGKSLKDEIRSKTMGEKMLFPEGTTFTSECFPVTPKEK